MKQGENPGITNSYGYQLSEKLRTETKDFNSLGDYERFALKEGYLYDTEPKLKAAYERLQKALNGELLTKEEFDAEIQGRFNGKKADILYLVLTDLVNKKILDPARVYDYARFGWCMNTPEALIYY